LALACDWAVISFLEVCWRLGLPPLTSPHFADQTLQRDPDLIARVFFQGGVNRSLGADPIGTAKPRQRQIRLRTCIRRRKSHRLLRQTQFFRLRLPRWD
jgi:hypothetical protein